MRPAGGGSSVSAAVPRQTPAARWLAGKSAWGFIAWIALICGPCHAEDHILDLSVADIVLDASARPPPDTHLWTPLRLPDNWNLSRPGQGGQAWYRLRFTLDSQPDRLYAVFVRKVSMNAAFYVNGTLLGSGGTFEEPVARQWNRPQFFTIPPALLEPGENVLHVRLRAYPSSRGGLGSVTLGPAAALQPAYERRHFVQTILPQLCNIVVASLGVFALALWWRRRAEPTYVLFFVFSVLWALRSTHMFVRDIPVSAFHWDIWVQSSFGWCALLFIVLAMRYSGLRWPRFEKALLLYAIAGPVLMYLAGPVGLHATASNWSFLIVPVAIFFEGFLVREAMRQRTVVSALLAAVWALIILASIHDGLVHRDKLQFDSFYLVSYAMILLSFVMGWILTDRFVTALTAAEKLNLELERRVAQKHAELEQHFKRLREMERETAMTAERRRITSEMHDGLGSQLISALHLVEQTDAPKVEIAAELREALDTLRLTIDSLEPTDNDLLTLLGNVRYRLEGRLKRQGIALDWRVHDLPPLDSLTPQNVLHILRILQEAFTTVLKHARARRIGVETGIVGQEVFIRISDDGCGFAGGRQGRGLASMKMRAQALGGRLDIQPSSAGTTLILHLPVSA
jgi:signal transduction histidine kinase